MASPVLFSAPCGSLRWRVDAKACLVFPMLNAQGWRGTQHSGRPHGRQPGHACGRRAQRILLWRADRTIITRLYGSSTRCVRTWSGRTLSARAAGSLEAASSVHRRCRFFRSGSASAGPAELDRSTDDTIACASFGSSTRPLQAASSSCEYSTCTIRAATVTIGEWRHRWFPLPRGGQLLCARFLLEVRKATCRGLLCSGVGAAACSVPAGCAGAVIGCASRRGAAGRDTNCPVSGCGRSLAPGHPDDLLHEYPAHLLG